MKPRWNTKPPDPTEHIPIHMPAAPPQYQSPTAHLAKNPWPERMPYYPPQPVREGEVIYTMSHTFKTEREYAEYLVMQEWLAQGGNRLRWIRMSPAEKQRTRAEVINTGGQASK